MRVDAGGLLLEGEGPFIIIINDTELVSFIFTKRRKHFRSAELFSKGELIKRRLPWN